MKTDRATDGFTVKLEAEANLPTDFGAFKIAGFRSTTSDEEFVALVKGKIEADKPTLVRIHSQCLTGDVFHSQKCDCGPQFGRGDPLRRRRVERSCRCHHPIRSA